MCDNIHSHYSLIVVLFKIYKQKLLIVESMSQLKLGHHGKPVSTGRPFRLILGLLSSVHSRSRLARFKPGTYQSRT